MIAIVGKAGKLIRGPRFEDRQAFLDELGFRHFHQVISLQEGWADLFGHYDEGPDVMSRGMTYMRFRLSNVFAPSRWDCYTILENIVLTEELTYLHCFAGVDRTGFICALYLHLVDGLSPAQAWENCINMGMHKRYQWLWKDAFFERCEELAGCRIWRQK